MAGTDFALLERRLGYKFKDKGLLKRALTHSSASRKENYEELEFLGDSVIQLAVTRALYEAGGTEGEMTARRQQLVSHAPLKKVSASLGLPDFMIKGVPDAGEKALSSVYEAVAGAIFADGGYAEAESFVKRTMLAAHLIAGENYKGELQEYAQARGEQLPRYSTSRSGGTENEPQFVSHVVVCGKSFTGSGKSKSAAEKSAAKCAIQELRG